MDSIAFLMKVWGLQCQPGDHVCLSSKGTSWSDVSFPWDANTRSSVERWLEANRTKNLYFCPLPFTGPRRSKQLVARSRFLWADIDDGDYSKCPPSVLWQSSPGRYQGLWTLPKTVTPEEAAASSKQLAYFLGADKGGWDLTQVLRIPGTPNLKYPAKPEVKLQYWKDTILKEVPSSILDRWRSTIPRKLLRIIEGEAEQGKRSDMLWYLEHELCDLGIPLKDVISILKDSDWNKYRGRDDEEERFKSEMDKIRGDRKEKQKETRIESRELKVVSYAELLASSATNPGWLVKDFWMRNSHGIVAGEPKSFKSTLVMDMLFAVASDTKFLGTHEVEFGGPVIVVQNENTDWIMKDRLEKLAFSRGEVGNVKRTSGQRLRIEWARSLPIHFVNQQGFMLDDAADKEALEELIENVRPAAITLDPLYLMFGGDVNSAKDLSNVLQWCLYIKQTYNCSVILVHHYNKNHDGSRAGQKMLGSTTLHGWIESAWYLQVQEPNGDNAVITLEREFRGAGLHRRLDLEMELGDFGDPKYQVIESEHVEEDKKSGEGKEQDILDILATCVDLMSITTLAKKVGMSRDKTKRLVDAMCQSGKIYRSGERYGLTKESK